MKNCVVNSLSPTLRDPSDDFVESPSKEIEVKEWIEEVEEVSEE